MGAAALCYSRARHCDPATGTIASEGSCGGSLGDPVSLNRYAHAGSDHAQAYCGPNTNPGGFDTKCGPDGARTHYGFDSTCRVAR